MSKPCLALAIPVSFSTPADLSSPTTGSLPYKRECACVPNLAHSKSSSFATTGDGSPQGCGSFISRITTSTETASLGQPSREGVWSPPVPQLSDATTLGWDEGMESTLTLSSGESAAANVTSPTKPCGWGLIG